MTDRHDRKRKGTILLFWLLVFVVMLGVLLFFMVGQTKIQRVVVSGSEHYTDKEVVEMAGIKEDTTILDVFLGGDAREVDLPYIQDVTIDYLSFNTIHIKVREKEVISYIPYQSQYLALDKDGYIVGYEKEKVGDQPATSGIWFGSARLGDKLDISDDVLSALLAFYHLGNKYQVPLEEIVFSQGNAEMITGKVGAVNIVFGTIDDLDRKMKDAAAVLENLDITIAGTLDLQMDNDYYILKEAVGASYYLPYGERYLAVDDNFVLKKISVHRMLDHLLITGLEIETPQVGETIQLSEQTVTVIRAVLNEADAVGLTIDTLDFKGGSTTNITVTAGDIRLVLGSTERLADKLFQGVNVISQLEGSMPGMIDLRKEQESYVFEADEDG